MKNCDFIIFAQNIDRGYTLHDSPQSMFQSKNKKIMYTPVNPILLYESGVYGG